MQREVEGGTWEFWVKILFFYFSVYKYITLFSQFIDLQLFFLSINNYDYYYY